MSDDHIYFLHKGGTNYTRVIGVVALDLDGNILWNFDKKGKGPGEFEYITFLNYLPYRNEIVFYDNRNDRLNFLNTDGKHQLSVNFKENCDNMMELPNGQLVANINKNSYMPSNESTLHHDLVFVNIEGEITQKYLPNKDNGIAWFWFGETLLPGSKELIYTNTLQYTLFTITADGVDSTYNLDFGEYNADTARYLHPKGQEDYLMEQDTDEVLSIRVVHTEKYLWVLVPRGGPLYLAVINKKNNSILYYQKPEKRDFYFEGIPIPMFQLSQNPDCFVYSLSAIDALDKWDLLTDEEKEASNPEWMKLMENLDPEGNPLVCMLYAR